MIGSWQKCKGQIWIVPFSSYALVSESSIFNEKHLKSWLFQEKIADLGNTTICSISINHKNMKRPQGRHFFIIDKCVWQPTLCDVTKPGFQILPPLKLFSTTGKIWKPLVLKIVKMSQHLFTPSALYIVKTTYYVDPTGNIHLPNL